MKSLQDIEKLVKRFQIKPCSTMQKQTLTEVLKAQEKLNAHKKARFTINIGRIIMKSKMIKFAAAAVIIIAALIGINQFGGSVNLTSIALGEVIENMKKTPWMHQISKGFEKGLTGTSEQWVAFESKIWIWKNADGTIVYRDYYKNERYQYDPSSQIVTISYLHGTAPELSSALSVVDFILKEAKEQNAEIVQKVGTYKNKPSEIIELQFQRADTKYSGKLFVDTHSHLLAGGIVTATDSSGKIISNAELEIEYPDKGPATIFELGVPVSAKIINSLPTPQVNEVLKEYQSHREEELRKYTAVVIEGTIAEIMFRDGELARMERRIPKNKSVWIEHSTDLLTSFDSLLKWWSNDNNSKMSAAYIYDGKYDYYVYGLPDNPKGYHYKGHNPNHRTLNDFGWPNINQWIAPERELKIIETDYSKTNNLICIELLFPGEIRSDGYVSLPRRDLYYLDTDKDYMCVRFEFYSTQNAPWQQNKTWLTDIDSNKIPQDSYGSNEVIEFAQTDNGEWYPKKIKNTWCGESSGGEVRNSSTDIYLDTNPTFSGEIFKPDNLPETNK